MRPAIAKAALLLPLAFATARSETGPQFDISTGENGSHVEIFMFLNLYRAEPVQVLHFPPVCRVCPTRFFRFFPEMPPIPLT